MPQLFEREVQKNRGVGILPAWIAGREKAANVACGYGAQQRVSNGVQQHIAVGVAGQALRVIDCDATDFQLQAGLEGV
jgi:hypothetical protein